MASLLRSPAATRAEALVERAAEGRLGLGEMVALQKGINSESPRHLTKVVVLG